MRDLIQQERFELEVLDRLKSARLLDRLVFGGGTMLRLCFGLNRYSVDLDFWLTKEIDTNKLLQIIGIKETELIMLREHIAKLEQEKQGKPIETDSVD
ncbi:MAG: nucleotidyl transferase AbiEii/AbiGii toxin family protein [Candidatus Auribacterota bacterium]|nr:nucleotidyl transferase AbiEii/AbiGii toxin family protein [Candidatus Auribacterota bacterium]